MHTGITFWCLPQDCWSRPTECLDPFPSLMPHTTNSPSHVSGLGFVAELLYWYQAIAVPVSLLSIGVWMYGKRLRRELLKQVGGGGRGKGRGRGAAEGGRGGRVGGGEGLCGCGGGAVLPASHVASMATTHARACMRMALVVRHLRH